jgi:hypothetical protein
MISDAFTLVHLICPDRVRSFLGYFTHKVGITFWKPLAIAVLLTILSSFIALAPPRWVSGTDNCHVLLMVWSVGRLAHHRSGDGIINDRAN